MPVAFVIIVLLSSHLITLNANLAQLILIVFFYLFNLLGLVRVSFFFRISVLNQLTSECIPPSLPNLLLLPPPPEKKIISFSENFFLRLRRAILRLCKPLNGFLTLSAVALFNESFVRIKFSFERILQFTIAFKCGVCTLNWGMGEGRGECI